MWGREGGKPGGCCREAPFSGVMSMQSRGDEAADTWGRCPGGRKGLYKALRLCPGSRRAQQVILLRSLSLELRGDGQDMPGNSSLQSHSVLLLVRILQRNRAKRRSIDGKRLVFKELTDTVVGAGKFEICRADGQSENSGKS